MSTRAEQKKAKAAAAKKKADELAQQKEADAKAEVVNAAKAEVAKVDAEQAAVEAEAEANSPRKLFSGPSNPSLQDINRHSVKLDAEKAVRTDKLAEAVSSAVKGAVSKIKV